MAPVRRRAGLVHQGELENAGASERLFADRGYVALVVDHLWNFGWRALQAQREHGKHRREVKRSLHSGIILIVGVVIEARR
jgi:hypothetical protein